jgi:hypothetical protein
MVLEAVTYFHVDKVHTSIGAERFHFGTSSECA